MLRYDIRTGVKKIKTKTFMVISGVTLGVAGLAMAVAMPLAAKAATPTWDATGSYKLDFSVDPNSSSYDPNLYDLSLTQSGQNVTGTGQYPDPGPSYSYSWDAAGTVIGNNITLTDTYTSGAIGTVMQMTGTIAPDGSMSGTWSDNYGSGRTGLWKAVAGHAASVVNGCDFDVSVPGVWTLLADCTATAEINVPTGTTLDGANHTISAGFFKTDTSNNAVLGVISDANVTIENLTIEGSGGTDLHGIVAYVSTNVSVSNVTLNNINRIAIDVNGSDVSVSNVTTANSGWEGIDVDSGSNVTQPSVLNVTGPMDQYNDARDIYIDSTTKVPASTVNDSTGQYTFQDNKFQTGDRLYTELAVSPTSKDQCMNNGWKNFQTKYKNQGLCVSWYEHSIGNGTPAANKPSH